jgi:LPS-assembly protein
MPLTSHKFKSLSLHVLVTAIAASSLLTWADTQPSSDQQWACQPDDRGGWRCNAQLENTDVHSQQPQLAPSSSPKQQNLTPLVTRVKTKPAVTHNNQYSQWDWVPKEQLKDPSLCETGCEGAYIPPPADWKDADQDPKTSALHADAASTRMEGDSIVLSGDVELSQGHRYISADTLNLDRSTNILDIKGNIELREPSLLVRADSAQINTETNLGQFDSAIFLQYDNGFRGQADSIKRPTATSLNLQQGSITQCTPDDEVWRLNASTIYLDTEEGWGSAKHARLNINDVPVLYVPYMTFPIDDRRKTGLLFPTLGSSNKNGFEFSAPIYLNLAPNYDATITPRFIEKRGTMYEAQVRQVSSFGNWVFSGAQLKDDQFTETPVIGREDDVPPREDRWIGRVEQSGTLLGLNTNINYNKVSDEDFFSDLSTDSLELQRSDHLNQSASLGYRNDNWQTQLLVQDYQTIDELLAKQYQFMPRLSIERNNTGVNFKPELLLEAEYTDFDHDQSIDEGGRFITGERTFSEAGISFPMRWAPGFIIPTAKVRNISYNLESVKPSDDDSPSTTVPLATLDMGLIFERAASFGGTGYLQTLEPRLYYLFSEHKEQNENPNFDSKELKFGYSQLFRDTRFTGHDRLDDANQASIGVTSRFIDDVEGIEKLTLSLGQIFYFEDRRVQLGSLQPNDELSNSQIASEIQYQPTERLWLSNTLLWDSRQDTLQEGGFGMHYETTSNSLYNLGYRFNRQGASNLGNGLRDLSQADASLVLPLSDRWRAFARYRYDIEEHRALDDMVGLQYEDCCWMVRVLYQRGIKDEYVRQFQDEASNELSSNIAVERDYAFILEFQLKGLGSLGNKAESLLRENILGYEDLD